MTSKIKAAMQKLKSEGHAVCYYGAHGQTWVQIDRRMLASFKEVEELAGGVCSLNEWEQRCTERRAEHREQTLGS